MNFRKLYKNKKQSKLTTTDFGLALLQGALDPSTIATSTGNLSDPDRKLLLWSGRVWDSGAGGPKAGEYVCPQLADAAVTQGKSPGKIVYGNGLKDASVVHLINCFAENDDLSRTKQAERWDELVADGLPVPTLIDSGGKSLHGFLHIHQVNVEGMLQTWKETQYLLIALIGGDRQNTNPARKMRLGGSMLLGREQYILHVSDVVTPLPELRQILIDLCEKRGIDWVAAIANATKTTNAKKGTYNGPSGYLAPSDGAFGTIPNMNVDCLSDTHGTDTLQGWKRRLTDGEFPDGKVPCCHHPFRDDKNQSAFLTLSRGGRLVIRDSAGHPTLYEPHDTCSIDNDEGMVWIGSEKASEPEPSSVLDSEKMQPRWVCPDIPNDPGVYLLRGGTGAEKTQRSVEASEGLKVLVVAPTQNLSADAARRFAATAYDEKTGRLPNEDRLAICLPSIHRVPRMSTYDLLVLDEIEGLMALVHSSIMERAETVEGQPVKRVITDRIYHHLRGLCMTTLHRGGRVIVADAFVSKRGVRDITRLCNLKPGKTGIKVIAPPKGHQSLKGQKRMRYESREDALMALLVEVKAGASGTIATDSKSSVETLAAILMEAGVPSSQILTITRDSEEKIDPTEWDRYRWVIFNQAAGSGVSYTGARLSQKWLFGECWGPQVTWDVLGQLDGRNRPAEDIRAWVREKTYTVETNLRAIRAARVLHSGITLKMTEMESGELTLSPVDDLVFDSAVDNEWVKNCRGRTAGADYWAMLEKEGAIIVTVPKGDDDDRKAARALWKDTARAIKEQAAVDSLAANTKTRQEIFEIYERAREKRKMTKEHRDITTKDRTLDRWGSISDDLVKDTLAGGTLYTAAKTFCQASAVAHGQIDRIRAKEAERAGAPEDVSRAHFEHVELKSRVLLKVLQAAGINLQELTAVSVRPVESGEGFNRLPTFDLEEGISLNTTAKGGEQLTWTQASLVDGGFVKVVRELDDQYRLKVLVGAVGIPFWARTDRLKRGAVDPMGEMAVMVLGRILRKLGLTSIRKGTGDSKWYTLDLEHLENWLGLCQRTYARTVGAPVAEAQYLDPRWLRDHVHADPVAAMSVEDILDPSVPSPVPEELPGQSHPLWSKWLGQQTERLFEGLEEVEWGWEWIRNQSRGSV